jgi:hypothetical protein
VASSLVASASQSLFLHDVAVTGPSMVAFDGVSRAANVRTVCSSSAAVESSTRVTGTSGPTQPAHSEVRAAMKVIRTVM